MALPEGRGMDRRKLTVMLIGVAATLTTATVSPAQGRRPQAVAPSQRPPAGLCRVWYDGVTLGRQPAPTSCRDAERRAGRNARVIYGDVRGDGSRNDRRDGASRSGDWDDRDDGRRNDGWQLRRDGRRDGDWDDRDDDRRNDGWQFRRESVPQNGRGEPGRNRVGSAGRSRTGGTGGASSCSYLDPNGRCVSTGRRDMPVMSRTHTLNRDQRSEMERYWLGDGAMTARYIDRDRNGVPEEILWYDRRGALVQRWQDEDRDGRVDEIVIYHDGVGRVIR